MPCPDEEVRRITVTTEWDNLPAGKTEPDATDLLTKPSNFQEIQAALDKLKEKKKKLNRAIDPCANSHESGCTFQAATSSSNATVHIIYIDKGKHDKEASIKIKVTVTIETGVCLDLW